MKYLKKSNNGDVVLTKSGLAILISLITIISSFSSIVAYGVTVRNDVDNLDKQINDLNIDERLRLCETSIVKTSTEVTEIKEDIKEIKEYLRYLVDQTKDNEVNP